MCFGEPYLENERPYSSFRLTDFMVNPTITTFFQMVTATHLFLCSVLLKNAPIQSIDDGFFGGELSGVDKRWEGNCLGWTKDGREIVWDE